MDENEEVCETCERETDELNDSGFCESCQLDRDIRRAEAVLDSARDR